MIYINSGETKAVVVTLQDESIYGGPNVNPTTLPIPPVSSFSGNPLYGYSGAVGAIMNVPTGDPANWLITSDPTVCDIFGSPGSQYIMAVGPGTCTVDSSVYIVDSFMPWPMTVTGTPTNTYFSGNKTTGYNGVVGSIMSGLYTPEGVTLLSTDTSVFTVSGTYSLWSIKAVGPGVANITSDIYIDMAFMPWQVSVTGSVPPSYSYYTWNIIDNDTNINYTFCNDDNTTSPYYDVFTLSVITGATYGATDGIINAPAGVYSYYIYEGLTASNLNINGLHQVEVGIMNIVGTVSNIINLTASVVYIPTLKSR